MTNPKLGYLHKTLCVGHEIAPGTEPIEAEILVAGYSFCYVCGTHVLGLIMESAFPIEPILRMFRDGVIEVAS